MRSNAYTTHALVYDVYMHITANLLISQYGADNTSYVKLALC